MKAKNLGCYSQEGSFGQWETTYIINGLNKLKQQLFYVAVPNYSKSYECLTSQDLKYNSSSSAIDSCLGLAICTQVAWGADPVLAIVVSNNSLV